MVHRFSESLRRLLGHRPVRRRGRARRIHTCVKCGARSKRHVTPPAPLSSGLSEFAVRIGLVARAARTWRCRNFWACATRQARKAARIAARVEQSRIGRARKAARRGEVAA